MKDRTGTGPGTGPETHATSRRRAHLNHRKGNPDKQVSRNNGRGPGDKDSDRDYQGTQHLAPHYPAKRERTRREEREEEQSPSKTTIWVCVNLGTSLFSHWSRI